MSIPVYRLYNERNNPYKLELRAGRNGLYKEVAWVHIMEDTDYASFLSKNELIFTTGMGKGDNNHWLQEFIAALIAIGSTGVVLNIGKYITEDDITEDVIALCNEHQFPLFTMPWNIRLSDITQDFLYSIFLTKQKEYEIVSACKQIFFDQHPWEAINRLKLHGFTERGKYQVMVLHFQEEQSVDQLETLLTSYKFILNEQGAKYTAFPLKKLIILMMKVEDPKEAAQMMQELYMQLHEKEAVKPVIGSSMVVSSLYELAIAYEQAVCAVTWACVHRKHCQYFGALGVYALLFSQRNDLAMRELHDKALGPVLQYDAAHKRDLFHTLESYIAHNGSIQAVAQETYAHRNTVAYRIQKIETLLQCDLNAEDTRFTYYLACHIHHYFQIMKDKNDIL